MIRRCKRHHAKHKLHKCLQKGHIYTVYIFFEILISNNIKETGSASVLINSLILCLLMYSRRQNTAGVSQL